MNRTDRHNEVELNFVLTQPVTFQVGGHRIIVPPGKLIAFWAAIPHQLVMPVCEDLYYVATIPLTTFLRFELPHAMIQAILNGQILATEIDSVLSAAPSQLESWIAEIDGEDTLRHQATVLDLQSLLLRIWSAIGQSPQPTRTTKRQTMKQTDVSSVERIAAYLALHYTEPLTIDEISEAVGLASGYAMTLFRKAFGQTMIKTLIDYRVAHAQRLLISTDKQILTIAFESGFGSLSRFNTIFKQHCGCSPREYRSIHRVSV